jgi:hypothetical protein
VSRPGSARCGTSAAHGWSLTGLPPKGARDATTHSWYSRMERDEPWGCWGHAGQPPLLSMPSRATWELYARSPVQPIPVVLGGCSGRGLEPGCGGYAQVLAPRLCSTAGGLASSNSPDPFDRQGRRDSLGDGERSEVSDADAARLVRRVCSGGSLYCLFQQLQQPWPPAEPVANSRRFTCSAKQNRHAEPIRRGSGASQSRARCSPLLARHRSPFS